MITAPIDNYSPEENSVIFFRHVKRDLGIPSTKQMVKLVDNVLCRIQSSLNEEQTKQLVSILPGPLQLLAAKNYSKRAEFNEKTFNHLDEFVEDVYAQDKKSGSRVLSTEVHALSAVVIILRKLDKYLNLFSYNFLQFRLVDSLKKIPLEGV
jgi:uncharacterized protein (DUF2267 family)